MFTLILHTAFTFINTTLFYWTFRHVIANELGLMIPAVLFVHKYCDGFFNKLDSYYVIITVLFRQWLNGTVVKIDNSKYQLSHVINGQLVKFNISEIIPRFVDVHDDETDESYFQEIEPFVLWKVDEWKPTRKSIAFYDNETMQTFE
jgi:hypothetical protein